ncbi:MAG: hypothetical protein LBG59_07920 [Candidatus Peribacteria bacterium]|jgi:tetrahydromethanopterin S-methyltransferase subunit G|nr:hypothetical protein [Candidatus Peribacteria bacterium]
MTEILADTMIYKIVADKSDFDKKIDEVEKRIDTLEKKVTFKADTSQVEKSIDEINQKEVRPKADFEELKK